MHGIEELSGLFSLKFNAQHFPDKPKNLYGAGDYFLGIGGKRIRPLLCLLAHEMFDALNEDAFHAAIAIELFHNFTLIHDDIMDKAPLRRGMATVHVKYNESTALLCGDVMAIKSYEYLSKISTTHIKPVLELFNKTAAEVCEGQQMDMDFEKQESVGFEEYLQMITLKTSVLIAASLKIGAIVGGAGESNCNLLYEFGLNLGLAFQIQDDYLDAYGDPKKFGKELGGDIKQNKKTFLLLRAIDTATSAQKKTILDILHSANSDKVERMLKIFDDCNVGAWALGEKNNYFDKAMQALDEIAVTANRKSALRDIAGNLIKREY